MTTLSNFLARSDVSRQTVADRVGITLSSLSRIAAGKQNTTADVLKRIIAASGGVVTADGLLNDHADLDTSAPQAPSSGNDAAISRQAVA